MDPLSRTNRSAPVSPETEIPQDQQLPQEGLSKEADSLQVGNLDPFREIYLAGRAEGKSLMSEANLNHVLKSNLTPQQYPEAFGDLKTWVRNNFSLTADQGQTLDLLKEDEIRKVQDAGARAAELNLPLSFEITDEDPSAPGPRDLKFSDPVVTQSAIVIHQKCERTQPIDAAQKPFEF